MSKTVKELYSESFGGNYKDCEDLKLIFIPFEDDSEPGSIIYSFKLKESDSYGSTSEE